MALLQKGTRGGVRKKIRGTWKKFLSKALKKTSDSLDIETKREIYRSGSRRVRGEETPEKGFKWSSKLRSDNLGRDLNVCSRIEQDTGNKKGAVDSQ